MDHASPATRATPRQISPASIHVRVVITWLAVFPMVTIGLTALTPYTPDWPPVLRIFVLTLAIVPLAVYVVVPWLLGRYLSVRERRRRRAIARSNSPQENARWS